MTNSDGGFATCLGDAAKLPNRMRPACFAEASGGQLRRPSIMRILYLLWLYNRTIWRNEANSSELLGFPGLSADFFLTALIFL